MTATALNLSGGDLPLPVPVTLAPSTITSPLGGSVDSFGRLRTSTPYTLFDSKQVADNQPLIWDDQQISGSGTTSTYNANQASTTLAVSNATAGVRVRQTRRRFNYQPGKSHSILMTGILGGTLTGITTQLGYFDENNGVFFQQSPTGLAVCVRTNTIGSPTTSIYAQSAWNVDKMDGTGVSGITVDTTRTQIFAIDFEWLGVGIIRFGFIINGQYIPCHQVYNANNLIVVYMSTPNLPLRYQITNSGTGGVASMKAICGTVMSEGGYSVVGQPFSLGRGTTGFATAAATTLYPVLIMRLKSGYLGHSVMLRDLSILCSTAPGTFEWQLLMTPTGNATYNALSFTSLTNSAIEFNNSADNNSTLTAGTGTLLASGVSDNYLNYTFPEGQVTLGSSIAGVSDILVLAIRSLAGTAETYYANLNWIERS